MAVTQTAPTSEDIKKFQGLSTDAKPTNCGSGSKFWELDAKAEWTFDANNTNSSTSNGWWEVTTAV